MNSSNYLPIYTLPYCTVTIHNGYGGNEQITGKSSVEDLMLSIFHAVD